MLPTGLMQTSHGRQGKLDAENETAESLDTDHVKLDKSNIILLGPTGCGEFVVSYVHSRSSPLQSVV